MILMARLSWASSCASSAACSSTSACVRLSPPRAMPRIVRQSGNSRTRRFKISVSPWTSRTTSAPAVRLRSSRTAFGMAMLDACVELDNAIIDGHAGITFGIHICRGNFQSMIYASGGYDRIAQQGFTRSRFDRFLLEYDHARSGTFEPLRHVPDDRVVVLGLVRSKKPRLEEGDELRLRIAEAAWIVPLERLALSPQCGFASTSEDNRLSPDDQRHKLEVVATTARTVWPAGAYSSAPA